MTFKKIKTIALSIKRVVLSISLTIEVSYTFAHSSSIHQGFKKLNKNTIHPTQSISTKAINIKGSVGLLFPDIIKAMSYLFEPVSNIAGIILNESPFSK